MREASKVRTLDDLLELIRADSLNIEDKFRALHHFSQHPPFRPNPLGFSNFVKYCKGLTRGIKAGHENEQTIQRTYRYVELCRRMGHAQAVAEAWRAFPLARN